MKFREETDGEKAPGIDSASVFPLLSGEGNQKLLLEWIENHGEYTLVDPSESVETAEFDCCITDGKALERHAEVLRRRKREAEPVLLPCLLLVPEADLSVLAADRGEIADSVVFDAVDEVVSMPIKKAELEWRTEALLRLRAQSLQLDRKRRELRLFKQATESTGHAVYITDVDGRIEYVNPAFEEITGYDSSEVIGESPEILDSGEMPPEYFENLWETISSGEIWREDLVNQRKGGEQYHAHQTIAPVTDEAENPTNFVAIQSDITERVETKRRLEMFKDIVERLDDPIMLQDRNGAFLLLNDALAEYADMSREELLGETEFAFMDEESAARIQARKDQVLEEEKPVQYTISPTFPTEDNETFSTVRYPYYGRDGSLEGTIAICRTVTELKSRENQLQVIDRVLRHNLRNDMTAIGMFAEKLQRALSGELKEDAERILSMSEKVNRMVDKERKITKFLTDSPNEQKIDLTDIVEAVVERQRDRYPDAEIRASVPEECAIETTAGIEQAIVELVENAIVHSDRDFPSVEVRVTDDPDGTTIAVADDGPGVPEMDRQILAGGKVTEQLYHGSGLGLWLVYLIVVHAGGEVSFTENQPRGSVVTIELPDASDSSRPSETREPTV